MGATADTTPAARNRITDDRPEDERQHAIVQTLRTLGYHVSDMSQGRPTRQTPGIPDLFVMGHRRMVWMEVKTDKGKLSDHQMEWHRLARLNRVPCIVVRNETDVLVWHEQKEAA